MPSIKQLGKGWFDQLNHCFQEPWWLKLHQHIKKDLDNMYPSPENLFRTFRETPFDKVKVVILCDEPYFQGYADGLAYSSPNKLSVALSHIYAELELEYGSQPSSTDLTNWAHQGVLLLNVALSLQKGKPGSHMGIGWEKFHQEVMKTLVSQPNMIVIAWGKPVQCRLSSYNAKCNVITGYHPLAKEYSRGLLAFEGNNIFTKVNDLLISSKQTPIEWIF